MIPTKDDLIYEVCTILGRSEDDAVLSLVDKLLLMFEHQKNLQQNQCTTQLPPTEDDFLHIAQFVRRMHNDFTDAELWHEYNKDA